MDPSPNVSPAGGLQNSPEIDLDALDEATLVRSDWLAWETRKLLAAHQALLTELERTEGDLSVAVREATTARAESQERLVNWLREESEANFAREAMEELTAERDAARAARERYYGEWCDAEAECMKARAALAEHGRANLDAQRNLTRAHAQRDALMGERDVAVFTLDRIREVRATFESRPVSSRWFVDQVIAALDGVS